MSEQTDRLTERELLDGCSLATSPVSLMHTDEGRQEVRSLLERQQSDVYF